MLALAGREGGRRHGREGGAGEGNWYQTERPSDLLLRSYCVPGIEIGSVYSERSETVSALPEVHFSGIYSKDFLLGMGDPHPDIWPWTLPSWSWQPSSSEVLVFFWSGSLTLKLKMEIITFIHKFYFSWVIIEQLLNTGLDNGSMETGSLSLRRFLLGGGTKSTPTLSLGGGWRGWSEEASESSRILNSTVSLGCFSIISFKLLIYPMIGVTKLLDSLLQLELTGQRSVSNVYIGCCWHPRHFWNTMNRSKPWHSWCPKWAHPVVGTRHTHTHTHPWWRRNGEMYLLLLNKYSLFVRQNLSKHEVQREKLWKSPLRIKSVGIVDVIQLSDGKFAS